MQRSCGQLQVLLLHTVAPLQASPLASCVRGLMFDGDVMIQNKEAQKHKVLKGWSGGGAV